MPPKYEDVARARIRNSLKGVSELVSKAERIGFNESDTRTLVQEILHTVLGYEKLFEITGEFEIKGHYADFAIKLDGKIRYFVEVKAIGAKLSEKDVFQVQSYSAAHNLSWMILTNGRLWKCYHLSPGSPPSMDLAFEIDIVSLGEDLDYAVDHFFLLSKEAVWRDRLAQYWELARATSPETIAKCLFSDGVLDEVRKELRRATGQNIGAEVIAEALSTQIVRGNILEQIGGNVPKKATATSKLKAQLPATCYAYVPDPNKPSTWKLQYRKSDGSVDMKRLAGAVAALSPGGFRGKKADIPEGDIRKVKQVLIEAYRESGTPAEEIPPGLSL